MRVFHRIVEAINALPFGRRVLRRLLFACVTEQKKSRFVATIGGNIKLVLDLNQHLDKEYLVGEYDKDEISFLQSFYEQGGAFVDIGANQGLYSLMFAKAFPDSTVVSFEPDPYSIRKFKENIELNCLNNITLIPYGLSDKVEVKKLMINTSANRAGSSMTYSQTPWTGEKEDTIIEVKCVTLLGALIENGVTRISSLKIDVEGYEYPILNHFFRDAPVSLYPKAIILEAFGHVIPIVGGSSIELLVSRGYSLVNHIEYNYFFILRERR